MKHKDETDKYKEISHSGTEFIMNASNSVRQLEKPWVITEDP